MDYLKKSRIEEVLIAILGKGTVTSQLISRIEKILDAIRTDGSYDGPVMSEVEEILVCILNGEPFEKPTHSRIAAMLKVKANGGEYTELRKSRVEDLIFEWINAVESATYTGTLPTTLRTVAGYLESYKIYGNAVQDGTPTPENPIEPSGCGVRVDITGLNEPLCGIGTYTDSLNLSTGTLTRRIKKSVLTGEETYTKNNADSTQYLYYGSRGALLPNGIESTLLLCNELPVASVAPQSQVGISSNNKFNVVYLNFGADVMNAQTSGNTAKGLKEYLAAQYAAGTPVTAWYVLAEPEVSTIPVPSGLTGTIDGYLIQDGTPTPETPIYPTANGVKQADGTYIIPYGYKLPLTVNGVEHPIYLGEVATTRRIKKYEFTGDETFYASSQTSIYYTTQISADCNKTSTFNTGCIVNAYKIRKQSTAANLLDGEFTTDINGFLWFRNYDCATLADFKAYLATQYAAGTPVTVWYVLAEPTTGIVNEPLMKIGDYADTIDNVQSTVQIPTVAGTTAIDYNGTPKPDKVELTYSKPK